MCAYTLDLHNISIGAPSTLWTLGLVGMQSGWWIRCYRSDMTSYLCLIHLIHLASVFNDLQGILSWFDFTLDLWPQGQIKCHTRVRCTSFCFLFMNNAVYPFIFPVKYECTDARRDGWTDEQTDRRTHGWTPDTDRSHIFGKTRTLTFDLLDLKFCGTEMRTHACMDSPTTRKHDASGTCPWQRSTNKGDIEAVYKN